MWADCRPILKFGRDQRKVVRLPSVRLTAFFLDHLAALDLKMLSWIRSASADPFPSRAWCLCLVEKRPQCHLRWLELSLSLGVACQTAV
jgi:hypothetical protein